MIIRQYQKVVRWPTKLNDELVAANFAVVGVGYSDPTVYVYLQDSETKDPTSIVMAYTDPNRLVGVSDKPAGPDGVPEALGNGVDVHTITVYKKNFDGTEVVSGSEVVRLLPSQMVAVNPHVVQLVDGIERFSVGPTTMIGELNLGIEDQGGNLLPGNLTVRFV